MLQIAPSILTANFLHLEKDITLAQQAGVDLFHLDVMDGMFVPNISFGAGLVQAVRRQTTLCLDVHLMITEPDRYIDAFAQAGADIISIHIEACTHVHRSVQRIREAGCKVGLALNPSTPLSLLADIITEVDMIVLMSVNPGFGGQAFIEHTFSKIMDAKNLIAKSKRAIQIEIDGGVNLKNIRQLQNAGVDICVVGSAIYNQNPVADNILALKNALQ